jgi:hypothetical protein
MKSKFLILSALVALAGFLPQSKAALTIDLGTASSFAILAGTPLISDTGGSKITGNAVESSHRCIDYWHTSDRDDICRCLWS